MVTKKETTDRLLMVTLNLLLAGLISLIAFGGKQVIESQRETTRAVNNLTITLTVHEGRISNNELKNLEQDKKDQDQDIKLDGIDKRVNVLERYH